MMRRQRLLGFACLFAFSLIPCLGGSPSAWAQSLSAGSTDSPVGRTIENIQFRGNRKVEDDAIRVNLVSRVESTLEAARVRADIRAIWQMGFFADVVAEYEITTSGGVTLTYVVSEKPSVRKVFVSGNSEIDLEKINEVLDLKREAIVDVAKIKQNRDKVYDLYVEKGFYLAAVDYDLRPVGESNAQVDVWFLIDERSKVEIREVSFIGNRVVGDDELRGIISTSKGGALSFLGGGGIFQEEMFERDLLMITAYYYDRGFINVKLGTPQIRLSRDKRYMYLGIPIDEGPVFKIGKIDFKGDLLGEKDGYYDRLTVEMGEVFNRSKVGSDINRLTNYYKDRGYAYVNITPLTQVDVDTKTVELTFEIAQGKKVYFERITVRGNSKTRDKVIRREMKIGEGELYSQTALDDSQRRINALGFFENVNVSTSRGSSDEFIEVNVEVAERPTGTFQIGAGFSSVESFIAQAQVSQNNLFGRGQSLTVQAQLSGLRQLFLFRFVEPYFLDTRWTFAFDAFNQSRAFGIASDIQGFTRNATGGNLTWGYPLSWDARAFLTYKLERVSLDQSGTSSNFAVANLFRGGFTSSLRASVTYDSRDNRLFPTGGWHVNGFFEVADKFTLSENIFVRYGGFARHYRRLWGPFVLKLNSEVGVTVSRTAEGVPLSERYIIGGIYDIRGFRSRSLGPRLRYLNDIGTGLFEIPLGGNLQLIGNAEIEFPLFRQVGISGVVFADIGNAYNLEGRYCPGSVGGVNAVSPKFDPCFDFPTSLTEGIRRSVGFGFRWISPLGPLRFEWGIPLDRQEEYGEDALVFEFTIGNFF